MAESRLSAVERSELLGSIMLQARRRLSRIPMNGHSIVTEQPYPQWMVLSDEYFCPTHHVILPPCRACMAEDTD